MFSFFNNYIQILTLKDCELFDINQSRKQNGELPGARMGHKVFAIKEKLLLVGGNTVEECEDDWGYKTIQSKDNLYLLNSTDDTWAKFNLPETSNKALQRANFGSCKNPNEETFYFCGGIRIEGETARYLSVFDIVTLNLQQNSSGYYPIITTLTVNSPFALELASPTISWNSGKLYLHGGNTGKLLPKIEGEFECNGQLIVMNIATASQKSIQPPKDVAEKMKVHGASSCWFGKETLMLVGGSEPPLGHGGRSIIAYTSENLVMNGCALDECLVVADNDLDGLMIECSSCEKWIHKYCDRKMRNLTKIPRIYKCPKCLEEEKSKERSKRAAKK